MPGDAFAASIRDEFDLDPHTEAVLDRAAEVLDLYHRVQGQLAELDLWVPGSRPGTFVPNGLIGEARQLASTFASLVKQLQLPEPEEAEEARSRINRKNVGKRYGR